MEDRTRIGNAGFPSTAWTIVVQAQGADAGAQRALEQLCRSYWSPLYAFARRSGWSREDAEDATQAFFTRIVEGSYLEHARREKGRLRSFLLTCFKRYLGDQREKARAIRRGGDREILSFDAAALEEVLAGEGFDGSPERAFDRRWAHAVLDAALDELEREYRDRGKADLFQEISPFLTGGDEGYRGPAERLGMQENAVGVAVYRLRKKFAETMRRLVLATVDDPGEVESELRHLMSSLG